MVLQLNKSVLTNIKYCQTNSLSKVLTRSFSSTKGLNSKPLLLAHSVYEPESGNPSAVPLFVTHGLLGSKQNWASISKAISRNTGTRVIAFDARNHGDSPRSDEMNYDVMAKDIKNLAETLNVPKFHLMGHSMGGLAAMAFALQYPQFLDKLIIVDIAPTVGGDFSGNEKYIRTMVNIDLSGQKSLSDARKYADSVLDPIVADDAVRAFLLTNIARDEKSGTYWKPNLPVLLKNINNIRSFPEELKSRQFNGKTFLIRGGRSSYVTDKEIPEIRRIFPKVDIATIPNAGHWPHAEDSKEFLTLLLPLLT